MLKTIGRVVLLTICVLIRPGWAAAPDIVLTDLDGEDRNVNEFVGQGKWTVVMIWAHDCPICNAEVHQVMFFHDANHDKGATVLGVTIDGLAKKQEALDFIERHLIDFPNLITEPSEAVLSKFGGGRFIGTPTFYIYSPDGTLTGRHIGAATQKMLEQFVAENAAPGSVGESRAP